ncbi:MAG: metal ABC transporter ATP-binding protein [Planctomycetes bacterium]|nr:metal ABC transporter ATP-binding protein [Planctomycetota bacterium]MCL4729450.1 metal ABC transporter ATP-binding protein [Planctomycetota bacterium]
MSDPLLVLDHVTVRAGGRALVEDVSLSLPRGQLVALIGPNGAGKTTLIRAILGLIRHEGRIEVRGRVGYVPQHLQYDRGLPMTVLEFMALSLQRLPVALGVTRAATKRVLELLELVGAQKLARARLGGLSGGELQRVMLAGAMQNRPELLLLDEPAAGVDIEGEATFHDLIARQVRDLGVTVVLVSHDLSVVSEITDHVICLNRRLMCEGNARDLLTAETIARVFGGHKAVYGHAHGHDHTHHHNHGNHRHD